MLKLHIILQGPRRGQKRKALSAFEAQDRLYLSRFVTTSRCRRKPWNNYFENESKRPFFAPIPGARCCDNCDPDKFPVEIVRVVQPARDRPGRGSKPTEELMAAITDRLLTWRTTMISRDYPRQQIITGKLILPNKIVAKIAERPRAVTTPDIFFSTIMWKWGTENDCRYGKEIVEAVGEVLRHYPDEVQEKREAAEREKVFNNLMAVANKQRREKLKAVFQEYWDAVFNVTTGKTVTRGRGPNKRTEPERLCQSFLALPRKTVSDFCCPTLELAHLFCLIQAWPDYYVMITHPISMAMIKTQMNAPRAGYTDLAGFAADWR
ncbi:hypothetical protein K438DRAFT_2059787 [Mycena galopus ATCC 62051]|nr:hypothetical protein K438DRAFT_2059787 [Mycena galopus ATCC 62051]